jgi:hypothetical protein
MIDARAETFLGNSRSSRMARPLFRFTPAWLLGGLVLAGCARDPVSSLEEAVFGRSGTTSAEAVRAPVAAVGAGRLPDVTLGTVWTYDVTVRSRTRPQDESAPWSEWTTRRVVREARAVEEQVLDGRTYVVIQHFEEAVDPPGPTRVKSKVPHRRDESGLYHRPPAIVIGTITTADDEPELARRGGPVGEDALLLPSPARPGTTFESNHQLRERWVVERHESIRTGLGRVAAVHTRMLAGASFHQGDRSDAWYAPTGRVASRQNIVRAILDPQGRLAWSEVDTRETLRRIALP